MTELHPAWQDLLAVLRLALERGDHLLTAGERVVVQQLTACSPEGGLLLARLIARTYPSYAERDLPEPGDQADSPARAELEARGLLDRLVLPRERVARTSTAELRRRAAARGLPTVGDRGRLLQALGDPADWLQERWWRLRHRELIERLTRWALLEPWPDRKSALLERLGHARWPSYDLTSGPGLWARRSSWRRWEQARAATTPEAWLDHLERGDAWGPGRLDRRTSLERRVLEQVESSRQGDPITALRWLDRLDPLAAPSPARAWTKARVLEQLGRPQEALALLEQAVPGCPLEEQTKLEASGRRLARALKRAWRPLPPLRAAPLRTFHLPAAPAAASRRAWWVAGEASPVEEALCRLLRASGRRALHAEGPVWAEIGMLLLTELCFLPVQDALPLPHLSAPFDFGRPGFFARREPRWSELRQALTQGRGPDLAARAIERHRGERIRGLSWSLGEDDVSTILRAVPAAFVILLLEKLGEGGLRTAAGLPDLIVLPGEVVRLPSFPSTLGPGLILVEAKSEGDQVRPAQAAWHHQLLSSEVPCEVWRVLPEA